MPEIFDSMRGVDSDWTTGKERLDGNGTLIVVKLAEVRGEH